MQIKWLSDAISDVIEIKTYIAHDKPKTAQDIAKRIKQTVNLLKNNPNMGRVGRILNTRELIVSDTSYIVSYMVKGDVVEILRVLHGAMNSRIDF
jgi:toxin ParE1/3/4